VDAIVGMPVHLRRRLASALRTGSLVPPYDVMAVTFAIGTSDGADAVAAELAGMDREGLSGSGAAGVLERIDMALARVPRPDIVWSGPEVTGIHARDTRQVLDELIGSARTHLLLSSYAFYDGKRAFETLAARMDAQATLAVTLCLNIQRKAGDSSAADEVVQRFAELFWKRDWPGKRRPSVFYDPRALEHGGPEGVLHAKAVVADRRRVLVTSANLTEAALDRNYELGLVVDDPALASAIAGQFQVLIDRGLLKPLPEG